MAAPRVATAPAEPLGEPFHGVLAILLTAERQSHWNAPFTIAAVMVRRCGSGALGRRGLAHRFGRRLEERGVAGDEAGLAEIQETDIGLRRTTQSSRRSGQIAQGAVAEPGEPAWR